MNVQPRQGGHEDTVPAPLPKENRTYIQPTRATNRGVNTSNGWPRRAPDIGLPRKRQRMQDSPHAQSQSHTTQDQSAEDRKTREDARTARYTPTPAGLDARATPPPRGPTPTHIYNAQPSRTVRTRGNRRNRTTCAGPAAGLRATPWAQTAGLAWPHPRHMPHRPADKATQAHTPHASPEGGCARDTQNRRSSALGGHRHNRSTPDAPRYVPKESGPGTEHTWAAPVRHITGAHAL